MPTFDDKSGIIWILHFYVKIYRSMVDYNTLPTQDSILHFPSLSQLIMQGPCTSQLQGMKGNFYISKISFNIVYSSPIRQLHLDSVLLLPGWLIPMTDVLELVFLIFLGMISYNGLLRNKPVFLNQMSKQNIRF